MRMISIPLPFVIALLLTILFCLVVTRDEARYRPVTVFLGICVVLLGVVGLRWSVDLGIFRFLQPVIAALVPPAAWLCFAPLRGENAVPIWLHFIPAGFVLLLSALWMHLHPPIDVVLACLFFGYGGLLLRRGLAGPDALPAARLGEATQASRAAAVVGGLLIFSGLIDLAIALDFGLGDGGHSARVVSMGSLMILPLIAWAVLLMGRSAPKTLSQPAPVEAAPPKDAPGDDHVLSEVNRILRERRLYRDPELTLERLSRRLIIPARQVSGAINRKLGLNVSQAINEWRIREAMELLADTDRPVTAIMFDCGFQTKSNFNREFLRVAGTSPSEWRRRARVGLTASGTATESR